MYLSIWGFKHAQLVLIVDTASCSFHFVMQWETVPEEKRRMLREKHWTEYSKYEFSDWFIGKGSLILKRFFYIPMSLWHFWSLDLLAAIQGITLSSNISSAICSNLVYFIMFSFRVLTCLRIVSIHIILILNKFRHV